MKLNHITSVDPKLYESIDSTNDSGFETEDLVKLAKSQDSDSWSAPMTADEAIAYLQSL